MTKQTSGVAWGLALFLTGIVMALSGLLFARLNPEWVVNYRRDRTEALRARYDVPVDRKSEKRAPEQQNARLALDVSLKQSATDPFVLTLALIYRGERELQVYEADLPWKNTYSLLLVGAETDAVGTRLEKHYPIDDPGPAIIALKPGQVLTGEIDLTDRFRDLPRVNQRRDVIIFWSYQLRPLQGGALPRVGGWVLIPKGHGSRRPKRIDLQQQGTLEVR
jgi:hypothetical protein